MQHDPACPICKSREWNELGRRRYRAAAIPDLDEYTAKRYRVLFEAWFPGEEAVELRSSVCETCGFVSNVPRPDVADMDRKYQLIDRLGREVGITESAANESERANRMWRRCRRRLRGTGNILDFGGGDGRLMRPFVDNGNRCFVIDYNGAPRPFVTKLGDTIESSDTDLKFDAVVCNHVIEHVAQPTQILSGLRSLMAPQGVLFVEVPMEIWRRAPLLVEPVTHINFFVQGSMRRLLEESGFDPIHVSIQSYLHIEKLLPAVVAIARPSTSVQPSASGLNEVKRHLSPGFVDRLRYLWQLRENSQAMMRYKASRVFAQRR